MSNSNDKRLFWASFLTLIAAGIGFSMRAALLKTWSADFGFTKSELGDIFGWGLVGFAPAIIVLMFFADWVGYGRLMVLAFVLHVSSAVVTLAAAPAFHAYGKEWAFWCLSIGGLLFSLANGTCETVINPLTATLFPKEKTHWLNILHAGWPGGLILGALFGLVFNLVGNISWQIQWTTFLVPTLIYGVMMLGRKFPRSEAAASGVSFGTMLLEFTSPILIMLLVLHAMVGYVELGTDSWISNITGSILDNPNYGLMLFIWTSGLMFALRFFAGPIVHKISPLGLLFVSGILGCTGLLMLGQANGMAFCVIAATVYGFGKTFLWPTMLGVVSERFPKGGALTLGAMGGIGMLSAGWLGSPGLGYKQDYFASNYLQEKDSASYKRYKAGEENRFLFFPEITGLDGSKVATLADNGKQLKVDMEVLEKSGRKLSRPDVEAVVKSGRKLSGNEKINELNYWWEDAKKYEKQDQEPVKEAGLYGGKTALTYTAAVPAAMALGYLILIIYFRLKGGYKAEVLVGHAAQDEEFTGGVQGPAEL